MVGASLLEFNHSMRVLINLSISLLHYCNFNMGNKICCDETHQKPSEIEKLDEEIVRNISVVEVVPPPIPRAKKTRNCHPHPHIKSLKNTIMSTKTTATLHNKKKYCCRSCGPESTRSCKTIVHSHLSRFLWRGVGQDSGTAPQIRGGRVFRITWRSNAFVMQEGVKPNGLGRMHKEDGSLYVGYFSHGRAHGRGVFIFPNGSFYDG